MNVMEKALNQKIDPFLTGDNLSRLASEALKQPVRAIGSEVLVGGCWNRVIAVSLEASESDLIFKINLETANPGIRREYSVLSYFIENTDLPVPRPLLLDLGGEIIPGSVLIMNRIPGKVMHQTMRFLDSNQRAALTDEIGRYVAALHRFGSVGFGGVELSQADCYPKWADFWLPRFDAVVKDISGKNLLEESFIGAVHGIREALPGLLSIGGRSTLTHYDIWSGNVMIDFKGSQPFVSGFIDIPGIWADYARELSFMEMFGVADDRLYGVYRSTHALDDGFGVRKSIYNLKMHMKHIMMYPGEAYYRAGAAECLGHIRKAS